MQEALTNDRSEEARCSTAKKDSPHALHELTKISKDSGFDGGDERISDLMLLMDGIIVDEGVESRRKLGVWKKNEERKAPSHRLKRID